MTASWQRALEDIPRHMAHRPRDPRGFPVPYFVQWMADGMPFEESTPGAQPDFRIADPQKFKKCVQHKRCWFCGEPLGRHQVFVIGAMCAVNRVFSEPPGHRECAEFAVKACPFLSNAKMRNSGAGEGATPWGGGVSIVSDFPVTCLWESSAKLVHEKADPALGSRDGYLFYLGEPARVDWYRDGRVATRAEVLDAINGNIGKLEHIAALQGREAVAELERAKRDVSRYLPQ